LGRGAFAYCLSLSSITFHPDAQLIHIGVSAFEFCEELVSIQIPSSVEILMENCFHDCYQLIEVIFSSESKLKVIECGAFDGCSSLDNFSVPGSVEVIGARCFAGCSALSDWGLPSPCRIRELLSLPPIWLGRQAIPDSVEILGFCVSHYNNNYEGYSLDFGRESRLREIREYSSNGNPDESPIVPDRSFLQVSSRSLKEFRANLEFDPGARARKEATAV
jgi:hypothetical protein